VYDRSTVLAVNIVETNESETPCFNVGTGSDAEIAPGGFTPFAKMVAGARSPREFTLACPV